ncbi:MAG TPA: FmdB family zinc ribbon protein [Steroidobacteraceae bacterium]|jgi:putative FmdB family regulatory protein
MPFYEYQCNNCGHALEAMQKITEAPLKKCPECGKPQLRKLMSAPVFRLKGGGWYETDFKSDQDNKRNLADRPEADASKDDKKETTEASGSKEAPAGADAATPEKSADKSSDKAADSGNKAAPKAAPSSGTGAAAATARRAAGSGSHKSNARKAVKRPARPVVKRSVAKPARRR